MWGFLLGREKAVKVNVTKIVDEMQTLMWDVKPVNKDKIAVMGRYSNRGLSFGRVILTFRGGKVTFTDTLGFPITHVASSTVNQDEMYPQLKNILNVL